jgi:ribosomal-protein-alanine N-acetyltransferase
MQNRSMKETDRMKQAEKAIRRRSMEEKGRMEKAIQIRSMKEEDLAQAALLEQKIFSQPWSIKSLEDAIRQKDNIYLVAYLPKALAGYCGLWGVAGEGQIYNVAVAEEYRNRKIGESMMKELLNRGRKAGLCAFTLEVRKSNQSALRLYEKLGFETAGIRKNFYELPTEDAVIMWLRDE